MQHHKSPVNILLTAGHAATTALATIEALQADRVHQWNISWIGPKRSIEGTTLAPFELELFPKLGVSVYSITAGKLQSKFTRHTIPALIKIPIGFVSSLRLLLKIKPQVVLSFGGFAALPVVIAATILRIPVVLHEQTVAAGLANKISGVFATKIALARTESREFFQKGKCVVVGNPLMRAVLDSNPSKTLSSVPLIYITGGSRGAQRINKPVFTLLPKLLESYYVIHQTGQLDIEKATTLKNSLDPRGQKRYLPYSFINPLMIGSIYQKAAIVIGRAGANTVSEVLSLGIPSIFIPIPWSRADEQTKNALLPQEIGTSILLRESQLSQETLLEAIKKIHKNWRQMRDASADNIIVSTDRTASFKLVTLLTDLLV